MKIMIKKIQQQYGLYYDGKHNPKTSSKIRSWILQHVIFWFWFVIYPIVGPASQQSRVYYQNYLYMKVGRKAGGLL